MTNKNAKNFIWLKTTQKDAHATALTAESTNWIQQLSLEINYDHGANPKRMFFVSIPTCLW